MVENIEPKNPGDETIGKASESYIVNKGRFATKPGQREIIEQGLEQIRHEHQASRINSKHGGRRRRIRPPWRQG